MTETTGSKTEAAGSFEKGLAGSGGQVADFSHGVHRGPMDRLQHFLHAYPTMVPVFVLMVGVGTFGAIIGDRFFNAFTLTLIMQQVAIVGIVGIAQTLVILTAGIDLSVGAIMVLSSVVMGNLAVTHGCLLYTSPSPRDS